MTVVNKLQWHLNAIFLLVALLFTTHTIGLENTDQKLNVVTLYLGENLQTVDNQGFYSDLLVEALGPMYQEVHLEVFPFRRAIDRFTKGQDQCLWGMDRQLFSRIVKTDIDLIESQSFFQTAAYVFTQRTPKSTPVTALSELQGKRVIVFNGSPFVSLLEDSELIYVNDEDSKTRMLAYNRAFAFLGWYPDIFLDLNQQHDVQLDYSKDHPITVSDVKLLCHISPRSQRFIEDVNLQLSDFIKNRTVDRILQKYGIDSIH